MLSKCLLIRIILEWFWCRKLHILYTNLLHSAKDSVKKESQEALLYNKIESFFPRTNSKEGASALLGVERVRGKNDSFLLYNRASCDSFLTLSLSECRRFV